MIVLVERFLCGVELVFLHALLHTLLICLCVVSLNRDIFVSVVTLIRRFHHEVRLEFFSDLCPILSIYLSALSLSLCICCYIRFLGQLIAFLDDSQLLYDLIFSLSSSKRESFLIH